MNEKIVDEIYAFLKWYRVNYGPVIHSAHSFDSGFTEELIQIRESASMTVTPESPSVKRTITGEKILQIHNNHPELKAFYEDIRGCTQCALGASRKNFVFGMGNPEAEVMFVGEAPGADEDEQGLPFVGRAGRLLDKMLFAIGLTRNDVYIANVLKCRPPRNRDPLPDEVVVCEPYLKQQIEIIKPRLIVALGRIAAQVLLKTDMPLGKLRHTMHNYNAIPFIVTYHPAALLRNSQWKIHTWQDLKMIRDFLKKEA